VLAASESLLPTSTPHHLALMAWSISRLGAQPGSDWLDACIAASERCMCYFKGQDLAYILWALGGLKAQPGPRWVEAACSVGQKLMGELTPEEAGQVLFGLATLELVRQRAAPTSATSPAASASAASPLAAAFPASAADATPAAIASTPGNVVHEPPSPEGVAEPTSQHTPTPGTGSRQAQLLEQGADQAVQRARAAVTALTHAVLAQSLVDLASYPPTTVANLSVAASVLALSEQASGFAGAAAAALRPHWRTGALGTATWERYIRRTLQGLGVPRELMLSETSNATLPPT